MLAVRFCDAEKVVEPWRLVVLKGLVKGKAVTMPSRTATINPKLSSMVGESCKSRPVLTVIL
jgi:hypothetical protein